MNNNAMTLKPEQVRTPSERVSIARSMRWWLRLQGMSNTEVDGMALDRVTLEVSRRYTGGLLAFLVEVCE